MASTEALKRRRVPRRRIRFMHSQEKRQGSWKRVCGAGTQRVVLRVMQRAARKEQSQFRWMRDMRYSLVCVLPTGPMFGGLVLSSLRIDECTFIQ